MAIAPENEFAVVLDACVLAPMPLCDLLLRCAEAGIYRPFWSEQILKEVARTLSKFGYSRAQAERRVGAMQEAFPEATLSVPPDLILAFASIPDPGDSHVAAAAATAQAEYLVTYNRRHFPQRVMTPYGILVRTPDRFMTHLFHLRPQRVLEILEAQASAIGQNTTAILDRLSAEHPEFVRSVTTQAE